MLRYFALAALVLVCGCPDSAPASDATVRDGGSGALAACVERPSELPRPPTGRLPCELIPPSLKLSPER